MLTYPAIRERWASMLLWNSSRVRRCCGSAFLEGSGGIFEGWEHMSPDCVRILCSITKRSPAPPWLFPPQVILESQESVRGGSIVRELKTTHTFCIIQRHSFTSRGCAK